MPQSEIAERQYAERGSFQAGNLNSAVLKKTADANCFRCVGQALIDLVLCGSLQLKPGFGGPWGRSGHKCLKGETVDAVTAHNAKEEVPVDCRSQRSFHTLVLFRSLGPNGRCNCQPELRTKFALRR